MTLNRSQIVFSSISIFQSPIGLISLISFFQTFFHSISSGWRRVSRISRKASIGDRTWCATWLTTMSTTGFGRLLSNEARPIASTSRSSSRCETVPSFLERPSLAKRRFHSSITNSTPPPANLHLGNRKATNSSTASQPTRDDSLLPMRYVLVSFLQFDFLTNSTDSTSNIKCTTAYRSSPPDRYQTI